jgi:hypothetical protein
MEPRVTAGLAGAQGLDLRRGLLLFLSLSMLSVMPMVSVVCVVMVRSIFVSHNGHR